MYQCSRTDTTVGVCSFGQKYCGSSNQCVGFPLYQKCRRSADCFFGAYCNFGRCVPTLQLGDSCNTHEACGRQGICLYGDASQAFGICTQLLSITADTQIMGKSKSGQYTYQQDYDKVCVTYWAKPQNGTCGQALNSLKAGQPCLTDLDCPTSDSTTFASCKCGFSTKGLKYCDIEGGDQQWLNAAANFQTYQDHSLNCHSAENFGPCHMTNLYKTWRCSELEASLYVSFIDNPSCLSDLFEFHPTFAEYYEMCLSGLMRFGTTVTVVSLSMIVIFFL